MLEKDEINRLEPLEDYGLNNNLENLNIGIHKILKLNSELKDENKNLKNKIVNLELNINTLIENNKDLVDMLKGDRKEEKDKKVEAINSYKSIEEYKYDLLSADKKDYLLLIGIIKDILSLKDNKIEDSFVEYLINISQNILENHGSDITNIEVLDLIEIIYDKLDEDLLIEFTEVNYPYILKLIEETQKKAINMIVKIGRILYSQEELIQADDYFSLIEFKYLRSYMKNKVELIDLLLIYNHLFKCRSRKDIRHLWPGIWNEGFVESNDILNYLRVFEEADKDKTDRIYSTIKILNNRLNYIDKINEEVRGDIRRVSYLFMINELEKRLEKIDSKSQNKKVEESINKSIVEEYFDHTLYVIKDDREICPFDAGDLVETNIVEKVYKDLEDFKNGKSSIYKEIKVSYCIKCKNYFIKESYKSKIDGYTKAIPIRKTIRTNDESNENEELEFDLNEESPLRKRGYHTALNDNKRWEILKESCIPDMGVNRVLFYLDGFVRRFSAQKKKDYSKSINIWKRDIEKIKREYE